MEIIKTQTKKCKHEWRMYLEKIFKNTDFISFFCVHCLELKSSRRKYPADVVACAREQREIWDAAHGGGENKK